MPEDKRVQILDIDNPDIGATVRERGAVGAQSVEMVDSAGAQIVPVAKTDTVKAIKNVTGTISATATLVAAVTGKRIKVIAFSLITSSTTAVTCTFKSGAGGTAKWTIPLQAPAGTIAGANLSIPAPSFLFATAASSLLELALSAAVAVTYSIAYFDDDSS